MTDAYMKGHFHGQSEHIRSASYMVKGSHPDELYFFFTQHLVLREVIAKRGESQLSFLLIKSYVIFLVRESLNLQMYPTERALSLKRLPLV